MSEPIATPESEVELKLLEKTPELESGSVTTTGYRVLLWSTVGAFVFGAVLIGAAVYRRRGGT